MTHKNKRHDLPRRALVQYTATSRRASGEVIKRYSTSFYAATRLLGRRNRDHIRSIYALVRVADELVDGVGGAAGLNFEAQLAALDQFETATLTAMRSGFSTDLVIHAFAHTARAAHIQAELVQPFFASMRTDLLLTHNGSAARVYDEAAHRQYVYGSAEVVGLMCLRVFMRGQAADAGGLAVLEHGARQLGAALQNINFLRDLADDTSVLGRHYLGTLGGLSAEEKDRWVDIAAKQLRAARAAINLLPSDAARAVLAAHNLFHELLARIDAADCASLQRQRVRVPDAVKARILAQSFLTRGTSTG